MNGPYIQYVYTSPGLNNNVLYVLYIQRWWGADNTRLTGCAEETQLQIPLYVQIIWVIALFPASNSVCCSFFNVCVKGA